MLDFNLIASIAAYSSILLLHQSSPRFTDSEIIHVDLFGKHLIILDSFEAAFDLLEKRSTNYSSRDQLTMAGELMGWYFNFGFQLYGNEWRDHRRAFHQEFHPTAAKRFHPQEIDATHTLLRNILAKPQSLHSHLRQMAGSVVLGIAYGLKVETPDNPYLQLSEEGTIPLQIATIPGAFLVDTLTWLKYVPAWFPGAGFQEKARQWGLLAKRVREEPYQAAKQLIADGDNDTSFVSSRLMKMAERTDASYQESVTQNVAGTMYAAGSDTTVAAIGFFIQGILTNPSVLIKAQAEIDRVIGPNRLPDFEDESSLPYISAIVKETLRWRPITPIAIPHLSTHDDIYKGYHIPADTTIIPNAWAMLYNEHHYPSPHKFNPDRFMKDGKLNKAVKDPSSAAFGFGRRICPARFMAIHSVWIAVASIVATFDITKPIDANGNEYDPPLDYVPRLVWKNNATPAGPSLVAKNFSGPELNVNVAAGLAFTFVLSAYIRNRLRQGTSYSWPLPPGPKRLPLIGNLLDIPKDFEWVTYRKWAKELDSDVVHIDVMGKHIVILDSFEAANDLLEKRSTIYSSRNDMVMANDLMGWDFDFAFQPYGDGWREYRRMFHHEFHPAAVRRFHQQETKAAHSLLRNLLQNPNNIMANTRQLAGSVVLGIAYGLDITKPDHPYIQLSEEAVGALIGATIPGAFLVDTLPWLKHIPSWFPGAGFKKKAQEWRKLTERMYEEPYAVSKKLIADGSGHSSFVSASLDKLDESSPDSTRIEKIIQHLAGTMYAGQYFGTKLFPLTLMLNSHLAGSDSTAAALGFFIQGVLSNPSVLEKGREEIDRVVGNDRLPDFGDEASLPYISAIVKETLRWRSVTPIAIPHTSTRDDIYKGYRIPAGTIIIPNAWSMLHDEEHYPDPWKFNPDRFMKDGQLNKDIKDPMSAAFGFGRRICPARFMAVHLAWISIASIVATLDIKNLVDESGRELEPPLDYIPGLVWSVQP
ncbi:hypothetical protein ONZ45_g4351 [Pleurotus djamor]|nr:hypothetical protein ONZ45_g4351 [Pleurotus djamor]